MRTKRMIMTSLVSFVALGLRVVSNFIVIRLVIQTFGSQMNGLIATATQIVQYLNILEGGIGLAIVAMLYQPLADGNHEKINNVIHSTNKYFRRIGYLYIIFMIVIAYIYAYSFNHSLPPDTVLNIILLTGLMMLPNFFIYPGATMLIYADQRSYVTQFVKAVSYILGPVLMIVLIQLGKNIYVVRLVPILTNTLVALGTWLYVRLHYKYLRTKHFIDVKLSNHAKDMFTHKISELIIFNTDIILLSIFTDFIQVSIYAIYRSIYYMSKNIIIPVILASKAGLGELYTQSDKSSFRKIFSLYEYILYGLIFVIITSINLVALSFIKLYADGLDGVLYSNSWTNLLFAGVFITDLIKNIHHSMISVAGHFKQTKNRAFLEAVINMVLSLFFVSSLGIHGVLIATLIASMYRLVDIIHYSMKYVLKTSSYQTISRLLRNAITGLIIYILSDFIRVEVSGYGQWFMISTLHFIVISTVFLAVNYVFEPTKFKEVIGRFSPKKVMTMFKKKEGNHGI
ncbi:hypothetical protein EZV73_19175 [Acidaminobacter sp. JC074]|uniref:lipopolysaccharide biosynthesis protein n=1 Tax=Acidaminobacter sp. JC074 TaxID=2530199 RepID=UPI001F107870|nr:hypothetical protein [Acidaminobacter sp. JC074]MCH4889713.1 hypothetical protein [Acidaminobacter sp. JC074]